MPSPTLSEIVAKAGHISFQCDRCRWIASPRMADLIERFGGEVTIARLDGRGRCFQANHYAAGPCGGRGVLWLHLPVDYGDGLRRSC